MIRFSTEHLRTVFADEDKYKNFKKLTYDLNHGNDIYEYDEDGNQRKISNKEANKAVRKILMEVCDLTEEDLKSAKTRKRALKKHAPEVFELIESDVDFKVETGFRENEWFKNYVDMRNIALGDDEEYWTKDKIMFVVAEISGDHHNMTYQHLNEGTSTKLHTRKYGMKVGSDIDLILLGRVDFTELTDKIAEAFVYKVMELCFAGVFDAADKLPNKSQFKKTGALSADTKEQFDTLLEDVGMANGAEVVIMGTKTALKKLNALCEVDWRSDSQKESVANTGRLGFYEGTELIEIPQRFALNDVTKKLIPNDKLLIFAKNQEQFVWFTDKGETEIIEDGQQKGDLSDDFQTYEVQREFGTAVMLPRYFGFWSFT
nr:hypothetical protein [Clostridium sp. Marseille-P7770]